MASIIWGGSFVITKDTLDYISPLWQLALRLSIASILALIFTIINYKKWNKPTVCKSSLLGVFFFGALCLQNIGMQFVSASKSGFLTTTYVAFVPVVEFVFLRRKVRMPQILAAIICTIGAAMLSLRGDFALALGDSLIIGCGFMYAVHLLYADACQKEDALLMHLGQVLTATVCALAAAIIFEPIPDNINLHCWLGLIYCGVLEVFLCFFLQIVGQKKTPASLSSILLSLEAVFSAFFAMIFLQETMSLIMVIGCGLIFISAVISSR